MTSPRGAECECTQCGLVFTAATPFDIHRAGGQCKPPDSIVNERGERLLFGQRRTGGRIVWGGKRE